MVCAVVASSGRIKNASCSVVGIASRPLEIKLLDLLRSGIPSANT
jgi:hypothetical protein